jgi:hypothetical protein
MLIMALYVVDRHGKASTALCDQALLDSGQASFPDRWLSHDPGEPGSEAQNGIQAADQSGWVQPLR